MRSDLERIRPQDERANVEGDAPSGTDPDGRLPGPDSVTWRHFGQNPGLFLAPTGLLLQVAHPVVGAGVLEHSDFKAAPWKRAYRTHMSTMRFIYGMRPGARSEGDRLRELHKSIKGVDTSGRRYHALQPEAYAWVHFTLAQFMVDTAHWFGTPMSLDDKERMWAEFRAIGRALGISARHMPADWSAAREWFDDVVRNRLEANESTYDVLDAVSDPAKPVALLPTPLWNLIAKPAGGLLRLTTVGTIPAVLRERLGLCWTDTDDRRLRRFAWLVRGVMRVLPEPLRFAPLAYAALVRERKRAAATAQPE